MLWPEATTFERSQRSYLNQKVPTVCCGQRPQQRSYLHQEVTTFCCDQRPQHSIISLAELTQIQEQLINLRAFCHACLLDQHVSRTRLQNADALTWEQLQGYLLRTSHRHQDAKLQTVCDHSLVNNGITIEIFMYVMSCAFHVHKNT